MLQNSTDGSLSKLWKITYPLIISMLSFACLVTADRYILSLYSLAAMNATTTAGIFFYTSILWLISFASIVEVFTGQFHGSGQYHNMPKATWQIIWLCFFSLIIYIPISIWLAPILFSGSETQHLEIIYYRWLLIPAFLHGISVALSGYFIGQKKVYLVTIVTVFINLLNILLNIFFVFGWGIISPMGIQGAALGTDIAVFLQVLIMFYFFISEQIKNKYPLSQNMHLDFKFIQKYLHIAFPTATAHTVEMIAHSVVFKIMSISGLIYITTLSIVQSIFFIGFIVEALNKGVATLVANAIGEKKYDLISKIFISSIKLVVIIASIAIILWLFTSDWAISLFLKSTQGTELSPQIYDQLIKNCFYSILFLCLYFILNGIVWSLSGILSACGKTKHILLSQIFCAWGVSTLPAVIMIYFFRVEPMWLFLVSCIYGACVSIWLFQVYRTISYKDVNIISQF